MPPHIVGMLMMRLSRSLIGRIRKVTLVKTLTRLPLRSIILVAIMCTSLIAGPHALVAHACSESVSKPSLGITTLSDGNRYIYASVDYSCVPTNHPMSTIFHPYPGSTIDQHSWFPNSGGGTNTQYQYFNNYPSGQKWEVYVIDQANGNFYGSSYITTYH